MGIQEQLIRDRMGQFAVVTFTTILGCFIAGHVTEPCCKQKKVGGVPYTLIAEEDTSRHGCKNNCVYQEIGNNGSRICFKQGNHDVECYDSDCTNLTACKKRLKNTAGDVLCGRIGNLVDCDCCKCKNIKK